MVPASKLSLPDGWDGVLPLPLTLPVDLLCEILLRLPAKELCRLRIVCRPWRVLLSDPHFIAAHSARHPEPLIVAGYNSCGEHDILCDIMDLSGHVVKGVRGAQMERVMSIQLNLVCTVRGFNQRYVLINPATGDGCALPEGYAEEHAAYEDIIYYKAIIAFGKVASTGEIKVFRLLDSLDDPRFAQLCEIVTLDGSDHARWRGKKAPPEILRLEDPWTTVIMDGVVYALSYMPDCIASFDLETEDWGQPLRGPLSNVCGDNADAPENNMHWLRLSMATLTGCLVVVYPAHASMDLWFLTDFKKGLWAKQYSIQNNALPAVYGQDTLCPLLVLEDGKIIVMLPGGNGLIGTYSPSTNSFTHVTEVGHCVAVGLYSGSLLSQATGAS
ncbi:hypothetical protein ACP70R_023391 [Stipagrostis hirtigluma subsp. patula]